MTTAAIWTESDPNGQQFVAHTGRMSPDWRVFGTTFELPDGTEVVVALLCRGGFEGEREDDPEPPPAGEVRLAA